MENLAVLFEKPSLAKSMASIFDLFGTGFVSADKVSALLRGEESNIEIEEDGEQELFTDDYWTAILNHGKEIGSTKEKN